MKLYKSNNRIICYIKENGKGFTVNTGKPSDNSCISWQYKTMQDAEKTAQEYFDNYTIF